MRYASDAPIAIVGSGPGGLSAALYLQQAGYTNVTVFERAGDVGGKCHSPVVDGRAYDLGALEVTPAYTHVLPLVMKYGLTMRPIGGVQLLDLANGRAYPGSYFTHDYGLFKDLALAKEAVQYLFELRNEPSLLGPGFRELPRELTQSFQSWLQARDMSALARLFLLPVSCYGYGPIDDVPAAYVLKYLDRVDYRMLLGDVLKDLVGATGEWPKRIDSGYQSLLRCIADDLVALGGTRLLTNTTLTAVDRRAGGAHPIRASYVRDGVAAVEEFDHLILASLLTAPALGFLDLAPEERALFDAVRVRNYYTSLCEVPGLSVGTYALVVRDGEIVALPDGTPCMIIKTWPDSDLVTVYTYASANLSTDEVEARLRATFTSMGLPLGSIRETRHWPYFPHVDSATLAQGFYDTLVERMGLRNTYFAGGLMNFEDVEKCFEWSDHLVTTWFT